MTTTLANSTPALQAEPTKKPGPQWGVILLSLPAVTIILALFIFPFIYGFDLSLRQGLRAEGERSFKNYTDFFADSFYTDSIRMTFEVALPVTLFTVAMAIPLAYYMRRGIRFERYITILLILPVTLGIVLVSHAMLIYFGRTGWFNQTLVALGFIDQPIKLTNNWLGVQIALFIQGFPFVFLMVMGYMSGINPDLEKASQMLGASAWRTFWRVIFPLALPGIAIAFCLNFVANFGVFPSAVIVGEPNAQTRVLSIAAYRASYEQNNPPLGTAIALIMGVIQLSVIAFVLWSRSKASPGATMGGGKGA